MTPDSEPKAFNVDRRGHVRETVALEIPHSSGDDFFTWTILKPGRVYQVSVRAHDPSKQEKLWLTQCVVGNATLTPAAKLGHTNLYWEDGVWVTPRDEIRVSVLSPVGIALHGALVLEWFMD